MSAKPLLTFIVAWLFPGAGHFLQKRWLRGGVFLGGTILLLVLGIWMQGKFYTVDHTYHPLMILGFLGDLGSGVFFFLIRFLGLDSGDVRAVTHHYGTTYLVTAGLINYLVALNASRLARPGEKGA
ncbi:MAG: hypothetical protein RB296_02700 [Acidobacteriota bacterium]|jgi:hypothetical protein|nr:hypothetical protein [Acidobacteriota bacterium]